MTNFAMYARSVSCHCQTA